MIHKVYVAGPMRGYAEWNYSAFMLAATKLRCARHEVFCPVEQDNERYETDIYKGNMQGTMEWGVREHGFSLREALAVDCAWICEVATAIYMLKGWEKSKGAVAERALAEALGHRIWYQKGAVRIFEEGDRI